MSKKFQKILVTGGAGFIGSHIVDRLLADDFEVTIFDNFSTGRVQNIPHGQNKDVVVVRGDVRNINELNAAMKDVDAVFHEAAMISIKQSIQDPIFANDTNVNGTLNVLKTAVDCGVNRVVFASSAAVYGPNTGSLKKESVNSFPRNPYGATKLICENYASLFSHLYGLQTISLRYFNVYGPRQSFDLNNSYGGVITLFLNRLLSNMSPVIFGDGEQTRDFVYVQDIAQANLLALDNSSSGEVFNVGSGFATSVNEVACILKDLTKTQHLSNIYAEPRVGDERHGFADISKATAMLGYRPKFSFEEGIKSLVNWRVSHSFE